MDIFRAVRQLRAEAQTILRGGWQRGHAGRVEHRLVVEQAEDDGHHVETHWLAVDGDDDGFAVLGASNQ